MFEMAMEIPSLPRKKITHKISYSVRFDSFFQASER